MVELPHLDRPASTVNAMYDIGGRSILAVDRRGNDFGITDTRQNNHRDLVSTCDCKKLTTQVQCELVDLEVDVWNVKNLVLIFPCLARPCAWLLRTLYDLPVPRPNLVSQRDVILSSEPAATMISASLKAMSWRRPERI